MKIKSWLRNTHIEDHLNLRVNEDFYDSKRDDEKEINWVCVQTNGVVVIYTK